MAAPKSPTAAVPPARGPRRAAEMRESLALVLRVLRANFLTLVGFVMVVVLVGMAAVIAAVPFFSQLVLGHTASILPNAPWPYYTNSYGTSPNTQYPFGTDNLGSNLLSLCLAALPTDLGIALAVTGFGVLVGGGLGLVSGFWDKPRTIGGVTSGIILRVTDIFLAFPSLILAIAVVAALHQRSLLATTIAIMFTWWPFYVRLVRGEVITVKQRPYVTAARAAGVSEVRILFRHIVRNVLEPVVVYFTMDIGTVIVTLSTIAYIGVGPPPTIPEWGTMISTYQELFTFQPWTLLAPGLMVFITVLAFSLLGDGLRDVLDPRSRRVLAKSTVPGPASNDLEKTESTGKPIPPGETDLPESSPLVNA